MQRLQLQYRSRINPHRRRPVVLNRLHLKRHLLKASRPKLPRSLKHRLALMTRRYPPSHLWRCHLLSNWRR
ncbi:hypothetical protein ALP87_200036 [Pseudomonas syringae pv. coriandricola]|nr:hypothetical protein ALP87_200036 [Pseudomonas syringae pv. coriandricola]